MKNVNEVKVSMSDMINNYIKSGGNVEQCKNHTGVSRGGRMKRAKNKNWVSDKEKQTGFRHTSSINRDKEREISEF